MLAAGFNDSVLKKQNILTWYGNTCWSADYKQQKSQALISFI